MTPLNARLFLLMILRGGVYGTMGPYLSMVLLRHELPLALLGPLAGVGAVLTLISAPVWGRLGDLYGRRRLFAFTMGLAVPVMLALTIDSLPVVVAANAAWAIVAAAWVPLGDSLTLDRIAGNRAIFARMRIGASGGYIATVLVIGALVSVSPLGWHAPGFVGACVATTCAIAISAWMRGRMWTGRGVAWIEPARRAEARAAELISGEALPTTREQARRHAWFLIGSIGVFAGSNAPGVFVGPRVAELGGSGFEIGLATAAGTVSELPAYLFMGVVLAMFGTRRTFLAGSFLMGISGILSAFVTTPELVIVTRLLFGAGYSWMIIPSVAAIASAGGPRERASLTGLHFATSAAGSLLVAILGVPLVELTGATGLILAASGLLAPIGGLIAIRGWPAPAGGADAEPAEHIVPEPEPAIV